MFEERNESVPLRILNHFQKTKTFFHTIYWEQANLTPNQTCENQKTVFYRDTVCDCTLGLGIPTLFEPCDEIFNEIQNKITIKQELITICMYLRQ